MPLRAIPSLTVPITVAMTIWISAEMYKFLFTPSIPGEEVRTSRFSLSLEGDPVQDVAGLWRYQERVDLRVLVLTYNRPLSLARCLQHVAALETDGDRVHVEVWVDRHENGSVDSETLSILELFPWGQHIQARVHVHEAHVGLYGQWIRTWRPGDDTELVLYVEDDVDLSPYAYRWLKAAFQQYRHLPDMAGISLQEEYIITAAGRRKGVALRTPDYDPIYLYKIVGPWAFSPHPRHWRDFQDWFLTRPPDYNPHVPEAGLYDSWYHDMERQNRTSSMWIMWFIHYCHGRGLYTAYANLRAYSGCQNVSLAVNRREDGLHFRGRRRDDTEQYLLQHWAEGYVNFPDIPARLDYDGTFS